MTEKAHGIYTQVLSDMYKERLTHEEARQVVNGLSAALDEIISTVKATQPIGQVSCERVFQFGLPQTRPVGF